MSAESVRWRIAVLDDDDRHMFWASESFAHELVREHKVTLIRRGNRTVALRSVAGAREEILELAGRGTALGGTRYSHRKEASDNIERVWAFTHLPPSLRPAFMRVLLDTSHALPSRAQPRPAGPGLASPGRASPGLA